MRTRELIERLERILREEGDIPVLLHVINGKYEYMGNVTTVSAEDDHTDGSMFVRIVGEDD